MNRWCDGFGRYGGTLSFMLNGSSGQAWAQVDSGFSLSSANPRTGGWHLRMSSGTDAFDRYARRVFGAPLTEVWLGKAVYCDTLPTFEALTSGDDDDATKLFSLRDQANNQQIWVMLGTDGAIEVRRGDEGSAGTILGRTIPIIGAGAYQYVELYAKASNTVGAIELRVDEITRLNLTGIDTIMSANVEFSQDAIGNTTTSARPQLDFADFYCNDNVNDGSGCDGFLGDVKSGVLMVNGDTAQADFALSSGVTGYSLLNETPPVDSSYISTASATAESDFAFANSPSNLSEILTVRPFVRAMKDDAGTCTIAPNVKSNSIKGTVSAQPVTTAFAYYDSNVPVDPNTGVPWAKTAFDAALHVVERAS